MDLVDAEVSFYPAFFSAKESDGYFQDLLAHIVWQQERITLYGKTMPVPRLLAWHGDEGKSYSYSGITHHTAAWTPTLLAIKQCVEAVSSAAFNSVLLNLYRDGRDSMGWHSDDEPELGANPVIGSVSFGETRTFHLRHKRKPGCRHTIDLTHGSLLLMSGPTQHHWLHQVPKTSKQCQPRINLTFRRIVS